MREQTIQTPAGWEQFRICLRQIVRLWRTGRTLCAPTADLICFCRNLTSPSVVRLRKADNQKTIYNESNGLWYELQGDYYIPCLTVPAEEEKPIGIWGQRHLRYIKQERKALYTELLTSGRLNTYLADINEQATEQMLLLTKQMAEREGVTEQLKAQNQML